MPRPSRLPLILFTAIITTIIVSVFWVFGIAGLGYYAETNAPPFAVSIHAPLHTEVGKTILMQVQVSNPTDQVLTLESIDLKDTLLDGFKVGTVDPPYTTLSDGFGSNTFGFTKTIASGETLTFTFYLEAVKAGIWTGNVQLTNPSLSFVASTATIRVHEAGKSPEKKEEPAPEVARPQFVLGIEAPYRVVLGENLTLRVNVTNPSDSPMVLDFIDLSGTLAEGIGLQSVSPTPKNTGNDKYGWALMFRKSLEPGETATTELVVNGLKEGIWTGDLEFWDENSDDPVTSSVTIRVDPAEGGTPSPD